MPSVRSAALGFFVGTGSRGESVGRGGALALPRAPAVPRHRPLRVGRDRPAVRRDGRRAERRHRQGEHHGLRADARPAPAARVRRDGRHGVAAGVPGRRPRARGRARGDRHVRGRPAGHGVRRARRGGLRRPPAGAADHRPRAGDPRHAGRRDRRLPRAPATCPASVVIAAAGSVDHDQIVELAERTLGAGREDGAPPIEPAPADPAPTVRFQRKDTEQCHVCLGAVGLPRGDDRRFASRVLDAIFGGLSSSRLFQAVREERGLAYSVYSFAGQYADTGQIGLYVGTRPDKVGEAMERRGRRAGAPARAAAPPRRSSSARARTSRRASCWRWSRPARA